ncbi:MAG: hypothetical protein AAF514_04130, partial [Verrucomicrobiota bacterium]
VFTDLNWTQANVPVPKPSANNKTLITSPVDRNALTVRIMEELAAKCRSVGARLVIMKFGVFQFPNNPAVRKAEAAFHNRFARLQNEVGYLDLDKAFAQQGFTARQLTEGIEDGHWNIFGHRIVADILRRYLKEQSLLK